MDNRDLKLDLFALGLLAATVFVALSLFSYSPADPIGEAFAPLNLIYREHILVYPQNEQVANFCGRKGAMVADILLRAFGWGAYYVILCLAALDVWLLTRRPVDGAVTRLFGWLATLVAGTTLLQMLMPIQATGPVIGPGGHLGALGRWFLESHFATAGSLVLLLSVLVGGLLLCTDYVLMQVVILTGTALINMVPRGRLGSPGWLKRRTAGKLSARDEDQIDDELEEDEYAEEEEEEEAALESVSVKVRGRNVSDLTPAGDLSESLASPAEDDEEYEDEEYEDDEYEEEEEDDEDAEVADPAGATRVAAGSRSGKRSLGNEDASRSERDEVIAQLDEADREHDPQDYELPPIDLLIQSEEYSIDDLKREVQRKAAMLEKTFKDFNLGVRVVDIETGPVIAQYEIELTRGLKVSRIQGLSEDLAVALRVPSVRIVRIPGKNTIGIEVPNDSRQIVRLREVMEETNDRVKRMSIPIYLGKDVSGNPLVTDLASLPHLLIAGRTGTGKSVCLNAIISSMLMTRTPDDVRMLMIDPKMVELSGYARLPHLMHPVVTDMRKAEAILAWACEKMDERYQLLARAGVRHVTSYNQLGEEELMDRLEPETDDEARAVPRHLPFIVIVADEIADLMMTAGKEVEAHIIRLAQKSRAVGIHLILATQKPTVDVITGLIKSNLPARIAFQVASKTDSRVVLDEMGADKLLGHGDMLFLWPGTSSMLRGQGTYLADDEIIRIVDYCGSKGEQNFVHELVQLKIEDADAAEAVDLKKRDELYENAVEIVVREGRGSVSLLQRNLQIGYGRAARLIDFMAEDGIVGTYKGSKAREVLMTLADWECAQATDQPAARDASVVAAPAWSSVDDSSDATDEFESLHDSEGAAEVIDKPRRPAVSHDSDRRSHAPVQNLVADEEEEELDEDELEEDDFEEAELDEEVEEDEDEEDQIEDEVEEEDELEEEGDEEDAHPYEDDEAEGGEDDDEEEYEVEEFEDDEYEYEYDESLVDEDDDELEDPDAESEAFDYDEEEYEPVDVEANKPSSSAQKVRRDSRSDKVTPHAQTRKEKKKIVLHNSH